MNNIGTTDNLDWPRIRHLLKLGIFAALTMLLKFLPETALRNAITAGWMSIGSLWMFIGLLVMSRKAELNTGCLKEG